MCISSSIIVLSQISYGFTRYTCNDNAATAIKTGSYLINPIYVNATMNATPVITMMSVLIRLYQGRFSLTALDKNYNRDK